jgi:hypothetical protein
MTIQTEKTTQIKDEIQIIRTRIPTENYGFWLGFGLSGLIHMLGLGAFVVV